MASPSHCSREFFQGKFKTLKTGKTVALLALILVLFGLSLRVTRVNHGYDTMNYYEGPKAEAAYEEVAELISSLKPHAKVYCTSPMLSAVALELEPILGHATFYRLFMAHEEAPDFVDSLVEEQVDFIVLGPWIRVWKGTMFTDTATKFQAEVRSRSTLIQVIGSEDTERFEVYALSREGDLIFNGDFSFWPSEALAPLGWEAISGSTPQGSASIERLMVEGEQGVTLNVHQPTALGQGGFTLVRIRKNDFPLAGLTQLLVYPTFSFKTDVEQSPLAAAGVEVSDGKNPTLWYTFADLGGFPESFDYPNGHHVEILNVPLNQWSFQTINIEETYRKLGWSIPDNVTLDLFLAVSDSQIGSYSISFDSIQAVIP